MLRRTLRNFAASSALTSFAVAGSSLLFLAACTSKEGEVDPSVEDSASSDSSSSSAGAGNETFGPEPSISNEPSDGFEPSDGEPVGSDAVPEPSVEVPVPSGSTPGAAGAPAVVPEPSTPTPVVPAPSDGLGSVGASCETTAECAGSLTCFNAEESYFGGTYPNGICTVSCASDPFVCDAATSACIGDETEAYCAPLCPIGDTGGQKCRPDQACVALPPDGVQGFCDTLCRDDMDCPAAEACDPASGLCMAMPHEGKAIGETCVDNPECEGFVCLKAAADAVEGLCSQYCGLAAQLVPCGPEGVEMPPGACDGITSILAVGLPLGPGDLGLCAPTCELATGCAAEGFACAELTPAAASSIGSAGLCLPATLLEPPDAGAPVAPAPSGDAGTTL